VARAQELATHLDLQRSARKEKLPLCTAETLYQAIMDQHVYIKAWSTSIINYVDVIKAENPQL
jgi:hypothetical protein